MFTAQAQTRQAFRLSHSKPARTITTFVVLAADGSVYGVAESMEHAQECAKLLNEGYAPAYACDTEE